MAMASSNLVRVFLLLVCFSHLIVCSHAVPLSRIKTLTMEKIEAGTLTLQNIQLLEAREDISNQGDDRQIERRLDLEIQDYPGSGPNGRHTP